MANSNISGDSTAAVCEQCNKHGLFRCAGCRHSRYCSKDCQKKAWPDHKKVCKTLRGIKEATSGPFANQTAAILFHEDHHAPVHVHLRHTIVRPPSYAKIDLGSSIAITEEEEQRCGCFAPGWFDVTRDSAYDVDLDHTIRVHYRDDFGLDDKDWSDEDEDEDWEDGKDDMAVNKALLTGLDMPGYTHTWKGPVIAYGIKDFHPDSTPKTIVDLEADDARHIINFMRKLRDPIEMVECVRLNCDGEVEVNGRPRCETITLPKFHAIFQQNATPISTRIEIPIAVARIPGSMEIWESKDPARYRNFGINHNEAAVFLHLGCGEDDFDGSNFLSGGYAWGVAPLTWDYRQGSCIVVRKDKKALHPDHVAALTEYCYDYLKPFFQAQIESVSFHDKDAQASFLSKQHVLDEITKDKFDEFFQAWKARQTHPETRQRISPYDV